MGLHKKQQRCAALLDSFMLCFGFCCCQARGCSAAVFALPAVQAVIHFKWTTWARQFLLYELFCYLAWLLGYTVFTLLFQQEVGGGTESVWMCVSTAGLCHLAAAAS